MSDGFTDAARDSCRTASYNEYVDALYAYLKRPGKTSKRKLLKAAKACDEVRGGWSENTNLFDGIEERLKKLLAKDPEAWIELLTRLEGNFLRFKELSPFADQLVIIADCRRNPERPEISGELIPLLGKILGHKYQGDNYGKYFIIADQVDLKAAEVIEITS